MYMHVTVLKACLGIIAIVLYKATFSAYEIWHFTCMSASDTGNDKPSKIYYRMEIRSNSCGPPTVLLNYCIFNASAHSAGGDWNTSAHQGYETAIRSRPPHCVI